MSSYLGGIDTNKYRNIGLGVAGELLQIVLTIIFDFVFGLG